MKYFALLLSVVCWLHSLGQQTDTIYFDQSWRICEQPFARYYRVGQLMVDEYWYYNGKVVDHYLDGPKQMEGYYDSLGFKQGVFNFYHRNGNLASTGAFKNNEMNGIWHYYDSSKNLRAVIEFLKDDFRFIKFVDSTGTTQLSDGAGHFVWPIDQNKDGSYAYLLKGNYSGGVRSGTWEFCDHVFINGNNTRFSETYKDGQFKKGKTFSLLYQSETYKIPRKTDFASAKFRNTEGFDADFYIRSNKADAIVMYNLLKESKEPLFVDTSLSHLQSLQFIIMTLNKFRHRFEVSDSLWKGSISYMINEEGIVKEVRIEGNLDEKRANLLRFLMHKFRNLKSAGDDKVGVDSYYKTYFFTLSANKILGGRSPDFDFFMFSPHPYEKIMSKIRIDKETKELRIADE